MAERREMRQERLENSQVFIVQVKNRRQLDYLAARHDNQLKLGAGIRCFRRLSQHFIESEAVLR